MESANHANSANTFCHHKTTLAELPRDYVWKKTGKRRCVREENGNDVGETPAVHVGGPRGAGQGAVGSEFVLELLSSDFTVAQDLRKETAPDSLTTMNRDNGATTVWVTQEMVTAFGSDDLETVFAKHFDQLCSGKRREGTHALTATRWTPTN